jgi:hypothetical protein
MDPGMDRCRRGFSHRLTACPTAHVCSRSVRDALRKAAATMTPTDRVRAVYRGEPPDRVAPEAPYERIVMLGELVDTYGRY